MNTPRIEFDVKTTKLSLSEGLTNSVDITFDAKSVEIHENTTTGERVLTGRSTPVLSYLPVNFSLRGLSQDHILFHLHSSLSTIPRWLCIELAEVILEEADMSGFVHLKIDVKITYETVVSYSQASNDEALLKRQSLLRMLLIGTIDKEERKSLNMETEPCSICLENLSGSKAGSCATRMACSHVFHDLCLLKWLERNNTCPLCRTELLMNSNLGLGFTSTD